MQNILSMAGHSTTNETKNFMTAERPKDQASLQNLSREIPYVS